MTILEEFQKKNEILKNFFFTFEFPQQETFQARKKTEKPRKQSRIINSFDTNQLILC